MPGAVGRPRSTASEPVGRGLVRAEEPEVASRRCGVITSRRNVPSTRVASASVAPGVGTVDRVVAEVGQLAGRAAAGRRWRAGWRSSAASPVGRERRAARAAARRRRRTAPRAGSCASTPRAARRCSGLSRTSASGTWCERQVPSTGLPSTSCGPVQPFGVRSTIIGQRGRVAGRRRSRASRWISRDLVERRVERGGHLLVHRRRVVALDEVAARSRSPSSSASQLVVGDAGQHRRVGDLVAVEVQDRQHRAVARRVEELVGVPAGRPAARSRPRRRRRRRRRSGPGCRTPRRRRATSA